MLPRASTTKHALSERGQIALSHGDLTSLDVDAIVNAADESLIRGGGVAAAIFAAAGPKLIEHCARLPLGLPGVRCRPGSALLTPGFELVARNVIHTVGPCYVSGEEGEPDVLANCYRSVVRLATLMSLRSIALPAIACGARGFPHDEAAEIAVRTLREELPRTSRPISVTLVSHNALVHGALRRNLIMGSGEHIREG